MLKKKINILEIKTAAKAGFCFGVRRAINLAEKTVTKKYKVYTLGPIIHNPQEVKRLEKKGVKILKSLKKIKNGCIILRTHGIPLNLHQQLKKNKDILVIDATCPFVKRTQDIIKQLSIDCVKNCNKKIVVIGEKIHPEVVALVSYGNGNCTVIENKKEAQNFKKMGDLSIVSQTTQNPKNFTDIVKILKKNYKVKIFNTICKAALDRQMSAEKLAKTVDLMIIIGGRNSGNTTRLAEICSNKVKTYHIETASDIKGGWFLDISSVGLTAGASTPDWIINEVEMKIIKLVDKNNIKFFMGNKSHENLYR
jgi:4-hydroxy-3-methylbut-2-enyl diphosphate reductase